MSSRSVNLCRGRDGSNHSSESWQRRIAHVVLSFCLYVLPFSYFTFDKMLRWAQPGDRCHSSHTTLVAAHETNRAANVDILSLWPLSGFVHSVFKAFSHRCCFVACQYLLFVYTEVKTADNWSFFPVFFFSQGDQGDTGPRVSRGSLPENIETLSFF